MARDVNQENIYEKKTKVPASSLVLSFKFLRSFTSLKSCSVIPLRLWNGLLNIIKQCSTVDCFKSKLGLFGTLTCDVKCVFKNLFIIIIIIAIVIGIGIGIGIGIVIVINPGSCSHSFSLFFSDFQEPTPS